MEKTSESIGPPSAPAFSTVEAVGIIGKKLAWKTGIRGYGRRRRGSALCGMGMLSTSSPRHGYGDEILESELIRVSSGREFSLPFSLPSKVRGLGGQFWYQVHDLANLPHL